MPVEELIRAKIYRLEELRKYQAYYGPNTPYPVVIEINDLEQELRRLLAAGTTRPQSAAKKKKSTKKRAKKQSRPAGQSKSRSSRALKLWPMSAKTFDTVVTISFIAFVFLLGTILYATYVNTRSGSTTAAAIGFGYVIEAAPTLRPTFTPTVSGVEAGSLASTPLVGAESVSLPPAEKQATEVPTLVPTMTATPTPPATNTPLPTEPPPAEPPPPPPPAEPAAPQPAAAVAAVVAPTATPPPAPPSPDYPFMVAEQGNREFQRTTYPGITIYIAIVSEGNIPLGGYKVVADHSTGAHLESGLSDWNWSAANCLDCGYIKQGNLKMDLGPFTDGVWSLYVADPSGAPLSPPLALPYASNPEEWVWDFVIFRRISG